MSFKESFYSIITFSICNSLTNKILAIIFSLIKLLLRIQILYYLKNSSKIINKLEIIYKVQCSLEIFISFTSLFMLIFSKYMNRIHIYKLFKFLCNIIIFYLFFAWFIDICNYASIKFIEFPDFYQLNEDPIFNYTDEKLINSKYSLEKYFIKNTKQINTSKINNDIFNYTYLEKYKGQIYIKDSTYFKINFTEEIKNETQPYQKRHRFEFNLAMILQLINIFMDILSYFLWKSIKYKHKNLIQSGINKKYGRKIVYAGYGNQIFIFTINHDEYKEKEAKREIRANNDFILLEDINSCSPFWECIMELIAFYGAIIDFIISIILRNKADFFDNALQFPFVLTYLGDNLYYYILIFLIINCAIDFIFMSRIDMCTNHHENIDNFDKQCCGGIILFSVGIVYLFFSICGIIGALFLIVGVIDSDDNLYIKTACLNSDISCYNLFQFASSFPLDNKKYSKIFYYIKIKSISKSEQTGDLIRLFAMLLIYFCQFYASLFCKIFMFNFKRDKFGLCEVNNYIAIENESDDSDDSDESDEEVMIDDINIETDDSNTIYKNNINDDYFKKKTVVTEDKIDNSNEMEENLKNY